MYLLSQTEESKIIVDFEKEYGRILKAHKSNNMLVVQEKAIQLHEDINSVTRRTILSEYGAEVLEDIKMQSILLFNNIINIKRNCA